MEIILIIASFVLLAALVFLLVKGVHPVFALTSLGLVAIFAMQYVNHASAIETTSGSYFFDTFTYISEIMISQFSSVTLNIVVVLGFVSYLEHIQANQVFATVLGKSVKKLKSKNLVIAATIVISVIIKWIVPSHVTTFLLLLSTIYPILRNLGTSKLTSISSILVAAAFPLGPNQFFTGLLFGSYANMPDVSAPVWFLEHEIPFMIPTIIVTIIVFILSTNFFEKKEGIIDDDMSDVGEIKDSKEYGVPTYFGLYPVVPLVLVLLFGGSIGFIPYTVPVYSIYFFCFTVIIAIESFRIGFKNALKGFNYYLESMGTAFGRYGTLGFAGAIFAGGLSALGGMSILINNLTSSVNVSGGLLVVIGCLASMLVSGLSGNIGVGFYPVAALFGTMIGAGLVDPYMAFTPFTTVSAMGTGLGLAAQPNLIASQKIGVPVTKIIIRLMPATFAAAITALVSVLIIY